MRWLSEFHFEIKGERQFAKSQRPLPDNHIWPAHDDLVKDLAVVDKIVAAKSDLRNAQVDNIAQHSGEIDS